MKVTVDLTGFFPVETVDLTDEVEEVAIKIEEVDRIYQSAISLHMRRLL